MKKLLVGAAVLAARDMRAQWRPALWREAALKLSCNPLFVVLSTSHLDHPSRA